MMPVVLPFLLGAAKASFMGFLKGVVQIHTIGSWLSYLISDNTQGTIIDAKGGVVIIGQVFYP